MTAVTLNPANGLSPAAAAVQSGSSAKDKTNDFGNLMLGKLSNRSENAVRQTEVTFKDGQKTTVTTSAQKKPNFNSNNKVKSDDKISSKSNTGKDDKKNKVSANEAANALGVMANILEGISNILQISEDELANSMDALGMSPEDLLNQNSLAELVLLQNGSQDMADMLVDNGMLETFNELRDFINSALEENGLEAGSFAELLASKNFKELAADMVGKENSNKILTDFYQNDGSALNTEAVNANMESYEAENNGAGLGDGASGADRTARRDEGVRVEVNPEAFINNLENAAGVDEMAELQQAQFREIAFQVVEQVRVNLTPDTTTMEMQLNPENLGRVAINISSKAGVMTAEITTENQQAKEAIESQLQMLKETIEAKGVRVEAIEVKVSEFSFADSKNAESNADQYNQGQNDRHPRRGNSSIGGVSSDDEEISDSVRAAREILQNTGSTVNYRA